jgi:uncharacterized membrane protein
MSRLRILVLAMSFLFAIQFVITGAFYSKLPETIPTHWNIKGEADGFGPRTTVWITPTLSLPVAILFVGLAWGIGKTERERSSLLFMGASTLLFFVILQVLILSSNMGYRLDMSRWVGASIGLLFALLGLGMKDLPRNHLAGIRLPWTMTSDEAWAIAHYRSARILVVGGLAGSVVCVLLSGVAGILISVGAMLWTIVDSYFATRPGRMT